MKKGSVRAAWESYARDVLPREAPATQRIETRRAFYAGAYVMLMGLVEQIGDESVGEADAVEQLERLRAECEAFHGLVQSGLA